MEKNKEEVGASSRRAFPAERGGFEKVGGHLDMD
jgi:hypothetical protein